MDPAPAWTVSAKGHRYNSCIVLSSMLDERLVVFSSGSRLSSCSLPRKCFTEVVTPASWIPRTVSWAS